jgi:WD40 repeat protein
MTKVFSASIAVGEDDGSISTWSIGNGQRVNSYKAHSGRIFCIKPFSAMHLIASAGVDGYIVISELGSGRLLYRWPAHDGSIFSLQVDEQENRIISAGTDKRIAIFELDGGAKIESFTAHTESVMGALYFDGTIISAAGKDLTFWSRRKGLLGRFGAEAWRPLKCLASRGHWVRNIEKHPFEDELAVAYEDGAIRRLSVGKRDWISTMAACEHSGRAMAYSPCGKYLASGGMEGVVQIFDLTTNAVVKKIERPGSWINSLAYSAAGTELVVSHLSYGIQIYDVESGSCLRTLPSEEAVWSSALV